MDLRWDLGAVRRQVKTAVSVKIIAGMVSGGLVDLVMYNPCIQVDQLARSGLSVYFYKLRRHNVRAVTPAPRPYFYHLHNHLESRST